MDAVDVAIDDLRPDSANPRRISPEQAEALTRSLEKFGFVQPVLVRREDSTVIGGHQRLDAAPGASAIRQSRSPSWTSRGSRRGSSTSGSTRSAVSGTRRSWPA